MEVAELDLQGQQSLIDNQLKDTVFVTCRMETQESCDHIIEALKGGRLPGHSEPLQVKFADSGSKRKSQSKSC